MIGSLEMLSGRGKKEYAKEAQTVAEAGVVTVLPARAPAHPLYGNRYARGC